MQLGKCILELFPAMRHVAPPWSEPCVVCVGNRSLYPAVCLTPLGLGAKVKSIRQTHIPDSEKSLDMHISK
jgi:hypothetical protein